MFHTTLKGGTLIAALLASTAAHAELTAEQVWESYKAVYASFGPTISTKSEQRQGDTLVIEGLTISAPFEGGSASGEIERVNLRERGDGTVEITMSSSVPFVFEGTDDEGKKALVRMAVRQPDFVTIASGTQAEMRFDYSAPSFRFFLEELTYDGKPVEAKFSVDGTAWNGSSVIRTGAPMRTTSNFAIDSLGFALDTIDEDGVKWLVNARVSKIESTSTGALMKMDQFENMSVALKQGFSSEVTLTYGATTFDFAMAQADQSIGKGTAAWAGGDADFALGPDGMRYAAGARDVAVALSGPTLPPSGVQFSYSEGSGNFRMPVVKSDVPGDFALGLQLVDLKLSDEIWALFDPNKVLPRDPATLVLDTAGKANWTVDIMDPAEADRLEEGASVGQLHAFDVKDLMLRAAGAEVTGKGAFTFDNSDLTTFDGMPVPTGQLDLKIEGANGLIDKLVTIGLLPEDQATGARMVMALFARSVEGRDDTLTSTIEFKDKALFANGQRLQ
jgi:hypothetical protein